MAEIINLAAARAARLPAAPALAYTDEQTAHAARIGRSPFIGTVEQETALLRRMEAVLVQLRQRAGLS